MFGMVIFDLIHDFICWVNELWFNVNDEGTDDVVYGVLMEFGASLDHDVDDEYIDYLISSELGKQYSLNSFFDDYDDHYNYYDTKDSKYEEDVLIDYLLNLVSFDFHFDVPDIMYLDSDLYNEFYNQMAWQNHILRSIGRDVLKDKITLSPKMLKANELISNGLMTKDDLLNLYMHPEHIDMISHWVDQDILFHEGISDNFMKDFGAYVSSLGYSDLYVRTTFNEISEQMIRAFENENS